MSLDKPIEMIALLQWLQYLAVVETLETQRNRRNNIESFEESSRLCSVFPFLLGLLISSPVYIDEHWLWYQRPDRFFLQFRRHRIFRRFRTLFLWISFCIILLKIG